MKNIFAADDKKKIRKLYKEIIKDKKIMQEFNHYKLVAALAKIQEILDNKRKFKSLFKKTLNVQEAECLRIATEALEKEKDNYKKII